MKTAENTLTKSFIWKDKSGRGFTSKMTLDSILEEDDKSDWFDNMLHEWAEDAEEGDEWEDRTEKYTCIGIES